MGANAVLARPLPRQRSGIGANEAQNLVAGGFRPLGQAAAATGRTRFAHHLRQARARPFAAHFHQTERREGRQPHPAGVAFNALLQGSHHGALIRFVLHVDEVHRHDAADVAYAQLPRDGVGRLQVGAQRRFLEVARAERSTAVHVDGGHRLGSLDDEMAAGFQRHLPRQRPPQFVFNAVALEEWQRILVQHHTIRQRRQVLAGVAAEPSMGIRIVDQHPGDIGGGEVADGAGVDGQLLVHQFADGRAPAVLRDAAPNAVQHTHVGAQLLERRLVGHRAGNERHVQALGQRRRRRVPAQALTFRLIVDALRNRNAAAIGQHHQAARSDGQMHGEAHTLGAHRVFGHLHEDALPSA